MSKTLEDFSARFTRSPRGRGLLYIYLIVLAGVAYLFFRPHSSGLHLPHSFDMGKHNAYPRENATFVTLVRNSDLFQTLEAIQAVEDRFNHRYGYDWVFLNEQPFTMDFIRATTAAISGKTHYGLIPKEHWSFPEWIDLERAARTREKMREDKVIYGDSISYRHMCRYESGFFFRHPLMQQFRYYWRVEPGIKLPCHISHDLFRFMREENKSYGFTISLKEYPTTIATLWSTVKKWVQANAADLAPGNSMGFVSDDNGETYNLCHFWSNFEVGDLDWLRSEQYVRFFDFLDKEGGFFYERWGDAPVHSIAASLMLPKEQLHFFDDVGYWHNPFWHCPNDENVRLEQKCTCDPKESFDWHSYSCLKRFYETNGKQLPTAH